MKPAKVRAERTLALAQALLVERQVDIREQVDLIPLAHILKERASVSYDTARRHVHRAVMLARGELALPDWGGKRGNKGGRPRTRPEPKTATIKAGFPIRVAITHPGGGYEPVGTGKVEIERSGSDRIVRIPMENGTTLVLTVF